jgi:predicted nucleic acid-binding protein
MIFVDTGAWYASVVPTEVDHATVSHWLGHNREPLLTTDYVVVDSKDTRLATVTEKEIDKSDKDRPGHWKSVTRRGTDRL